MKPNLSLITLLVLVGVMGGNAADTTNVMDEIRMSYLIRRSQEINFPYVAAYRETLVTNVSETTNAKGCKTWQGINDSGWSLYHPAHEGCGPYTPPTQKVVYHSVTKELRLTIWHDNKTFPLTHSTHVTNWFERFEVEPLAWVKSSKEIFLWEPLRHDIRWVTNRIEYQRGYVFTNIFKP